MRYVIIGAGSIGGALAARLARQDPDLPLLVVRPGRLDAFRDGVRLRTPDEDLTVTVPLATGPEDADLRADDVLVLATKTHQADEALRSWADAPVRSAGDTGADGAVLGTASELLPVFTALNGVEAERIAQRYFDRVHGVTVWLPAVSLETAEVVVGIGPTIGILTIGSVPATPAADHPELERFATDFRASGVDVHVEDDVMPWKFFKLLSNLANALQALLGPDADSGDLAKALRDEARAVYAAAGIEPVSSEAERARRGATFEPRPVPGVDAVTGGSSWQSLARGSGSIETDYLNGEIARIARAAGVPAPRNALVQRLARIAARDRVEPGSMRAEDLRAMFDALDRRRRDAAATPTPTPPLSDPSAAP